MIATFTAAIALRATITFPEIIQHMHDDYRKLQAYEDETTLIYNGAPMPTKIARRIDGKRSACFFYTKDVLTEENFFDGKTYLSISPLGRSYHRIDGHNPEFEQPFTPPGTTGNAFNWHFNGAYDITFDIPSPTVTQTGTATLDDQPYRTIDISSSPSKGEGENLHVKFYFEPNAYILRRLELTSTDNQGNPVNLVIICKATHGAKFADADFTFDKELLKDFTKIGE
jgi:hypothetical protein